MALKQLDVCMQRNESRHRRFTLHTINSHWITDLTVKHNRIKLLQDSTGENIDVFGFEDDFVDMTPKI